MTPEGLDIDDIYFKWGMTLNEVKNAFKVNHSSIIKKSSSDVFKIKCNKIVGLPALTCLFTEASFNKPVIHTCFDLTPIKTKLFEKSYDPFVEHLTKLLGPPFEIINKLKNGIQYNKHNPNHIITYSCKWLLAENIVVSLLVNGKPTVTKAGKCAAVLHFEWINEKKSASPYYNDFVKTENDLSASVSGLKKMKLGYKQSPYYKPLLYHQKDIQLALHDKTVKAAQLILYTNSLYRTPIDISEELNEYEIAIFKSEKLKVWCLCNTWDFTVLHKKSIMNYIEVKPAKGAGGVDMIVNSLKIQDINDNILKELSKKLEELSGLQFEKITTYDV